jgi:hypothetical protein
MCKIFVFCPSIINNKQWNVYVLCWMVDCWIPIKTYADDSFIQRRKRKERERNEEGQQQWHKHI